MAREYNGNYDALIWVQDELQKSLATALQAFTSFIDASGNREAIEQSISHIHQVNGTLEMLNLHGARLLANELLSSSIALRDEKNTINTQSQDSVLKGLMLLPNYLKLLGSKLQDHPLCLISTLNELRTSRGSQAFEENELFAPNFLVPLPQHLIRDPRTPLPKISIPPRKLSHAFQSSLLHWFKENDDTSLQRMGNILRYLRLSCKQERSIILWWSAEGVIECLLNKSLPQSSEIKLILGKLNLPITLFTHKGEQEFIALFPSQLTQTLLLQVASTVNSGKHALLLKKTFKLNFFDPQQQQRIYSFSDSSSLDVHSELLNQIQEIKEEVNILNEQGQSPEIINSIVNQLNSMAGTFDLLSDNEASNRLRSQADTFNAFITSKETPTDSHLMSLANSLLHIEHKLQSGQSGQEIDNQDSNKSNELQQIVISECLNELTSIKENFVDLTDNPDEAAETLSTISTQLKLIAGSLTMLDLNDAANLLEKTAKQLTTTALEDEHLSSRNLGLFAEIIASVDFYMEGIIHGGAHQVQLIDNAQNILYQFNLTPEELQRSTSVELELDEEWEQTIFHVPEETSVTRYIAELENTANTQSKTTSVEKYIERLNKEAESIPSETGVAQYIASLSTSAIQEEPTGVALYIAQLEKEPSANLALKETDLNEAKAGHALQFPEDIDPEIAEIFIEESHDVLAELSTLIPQWKLNKSNNSLSEIRRHFHTLKGSGRMVNASVIANLSWSLEQLLNQVLDSAKPLSAKLTELIDDSYQALPNLVSQFSRGDLNPTEQSQQITDRADQLLSEKDDNNEEDELQEIFHSEASQHIAVFKDTLKKARSPFALNEELTRAAHSLKGCANIAQIDIVGPVATKLDATLRTLYEHGLTLNKKQISSLSSTINGLEKVINTPEKPSRFTSEKALIDRLDSLLPSQEKLRELQGQESRIDPDFLAVFMEETSELLHSYNTQLGLLVQQPDNSEYQSNVLQTLASLSDNAEYSKQSSLASLYQSLARLVPSIDNNDQVLSLLDVGYEEVNTQIEELVQNQPASSIDNFSQQVEAVLKPKKKTKIKTKEKAKNKVEKVSPKTSESFIEIFVPPNDDPELLDAFTEECAELLESSGNAIKIWQHDNNDQEAVLQLQRDLHTLKGGSRLTGIIPIADLTHQTESLTFLAIDNKCETDNRFFNLLQRCQDRLSEMQEQLSDKADLAFAHDLIAEIAQFSNQPVPIQAVVAKPTNPTLEPATNRIDVPVQHEQIRVRADLLDLLSNFAGEVSISRDRVSQQNMAIQHQLTEMNSTVARLQDQLRNLEIETETQILFRYEDESSEQYSEFDPLELDRFSMIQQLSRSLTESLSDINEITLSLDGLVRNSDAVLLQQARLSTDLQQGLMNTRLLPFEGLIPRFERIIRQTNAELGKKAKLSVQGASQELDRTILDRIIAPIEHILRNAIAHGIELPAERIQAGKGETGQLSISISREGSEILVTLTDDGQGVDIEKVRKKALSLDLITAENMPSDDELIQLILTSGFSTAEDVSQLSGRGVGMDVVSSEIRALKGRLSIQSAPGEGTTFNIRLPLTLSILQALLVDCGEHEYAIPLIAVNAVERMSVRKINALLSSDDKAQYEFNGDSYEFIPLANLLQQPLILPDEEKAQLPVLLFRYGDMNIALLVNAINNNREIVLKPVGEQLAHINAITGATILGDGHVVFILDIPTLVDSYHAEENIGGILKSSSAVEAGDKIPTALVVDDSITMRKASSNLLKRHGFDVVTANDGVDAVAQLNEQAPDIILLDVEMPRMDGFEFATLVRNIAEYKDLPIIMITSRTGDKHRDRAFNIGVNAYLGKPYQEVELMETIQALLPLISI